MKGVKDEEKMGCGGEEEKEEERGNGRGEELYKENCVSCEGEKYEGGGGGGLKGVGEKVEVGEMKKKIEEGGKGMGGGVMGNEKVDEM